MLKTVQPDTTGKNHTKENGRSLNFFIEPASALIGFVVPVIAIQRATSLHGPGQESWTRAFCLATRRCMNLGPSFL